MIQYILKDLKKKGKTRETITEEERTSLIQEAEECMACSSDIVIAEAEDIYEFLGMEKELEEARISYRVTYIRNND